MPSAVAGLGLVPDRSFFPHHTEEWVSTVEQNAAALGHPLVTLWEDGGAYVSPPDAAGPSSITS